MILVPRNQIPLISSKGDRPAGLALIASIRKRLYSLPSGVVAEERWRVRLPKAACAELTRALLKCLL